MGVDRDQALEILANGAPGSPLLRNLSKKMVARELDGTAAFMQGKLKVAGDMSVAMKLGPILAKAAG